MNISYEWYRIFHAVAEARSITLAAENLRISQPAVSQCVKQLEGALGCLLFTRSAKGVRLTAEGEALYTHIREGVAQFAEGERQLLSQLQLERGEISIGASDMTLEFFLLPFLEAFSNRHPDIRIRITNHPTPETLRLLGEGGIDFCAVSEPLPAMKDLVSVPVRAIEDIFIAGQRYAELADRPLGPSDLALLPLILLEQTTSTRAYIDDFFGAHGIVLNPEFELATSRLIVQFAKRSLGLGCVVRDFAAAALARGEVFEVRLRHPIAPRQIRIVRRDGALSKAAEALLCTSFSTAASTSTAPDATAIIRSS